MVFCITLILTVQTLPTVEKYKGTKELAIKVTQNIKKGEVIAAYNTGNRPGIVFYNSKPIVFLENEKEAIKFIRNKEGYCFTTITELEKFKKIGNLLDKQGELAVLY
jgi:hypothetical protein